jgi:hypothetical protein
MSAGYHRERESCTGVNLLRVLNISERVNILKVCTFDWEASRNTATGKDKRVIRDYFLSILKSNGFVGGVYGCDSLFPSLY